MASKLNRLASRTGKLATAPASIAFADSDAFDAVRTGTDLADEACGQERRGLLVGPETGLNNS